MEHDDVAKEKVYAVTFEVVRIGLAKDNHRALSRPESVNQLGVQTVIVSCG